MPLWLGKGTFGRRLNFCVEAIIGNDYSVISANIRDAVLMVHALLCSPSTMETDIDSKKETEPCVSSLFETQKDKGLGSES